MWSNHSDPLIISRSKGSGFEHQIMKVYRANIEFVYENYFHDKLTFEQAEIVGKKSISGYLYEHSLSNIAA